MGRSEGFKKKEDLCEYDPRGGSFDPVRSARP
jgi:hypothetical protein